MSQSTKQPPRWTKLHGAVLLGFLLSLMPALARATPMYRGQSVWKVSKSTGWYLVMAGEPGSVVEYIVPRTTRKYRYTGSDVCGFATIKLPSGRFTEFEANGRLLNPLTAPTFSGSYSCSTSSERANISVNSYNPETRTFYFLAGWRTAVQFTWLQFDSGKATLNRCGYSEVFLAGVNDGTATVNGTDYNFATLPVAPHPLSCRTIGGVSVPYAPEGF